MKRVQEEAQYAVVLGQRACRNGMGCRGVLAEVVDWKKLEPDVLGRLVLESEVSRAEMVRFEVLRFVVLRSVLVEAKEAMATKKMWKRNDDRCWEAARLESLCQRDAQRGNEQILVAGRRSRRARR